MTNPDARADVAARAGQRLRRGSARLRSRLLPWDRAQDAIATLQAQPRYAGLGARDAVALFQKRAGLTVTGELDARTEAALLAAGTDLASPWERLGAMEAQLARLEQRLGTSDHLLDALVTESAGPERATSSLLLWLPVGAGGSRWLTMGGRRDLFVLKKLAASGLSGYEPGTLATILALLDAAPGGFLDVGANVGVFSFVVGACKPDVPVVAFEPTPDLAAEIRTLAGRNDRVVDVHEVALGTSDGEVTLYISPTDTSNSLRKGFRQAVDEVTVPCRRLDTWLAETGMAPPTVIKVDTESTEPDVLTGGAELVEQHRPWLVVEVLRGRTEEALQAFCDRHDYEAHHIVEDGPGMATAIEGDESYEHLNWLFAPRALPDSFRTDFARWSSVLDRAVTLDRREG